MIFAQVSHELHRVVAVHHLYDEPYFMLLGKNGTTLSGYLKSMWKFHVGPTAILLTLVFGGEYPFPQEPWRCPLPAAWLQTDAKITRAIFMMDKLAKAVPTHHMKDKE